MGAYASREGLKIAGTVIPPGETRKIRLKVSERYTGSPVTLPMRVSCGPQIGPVLFVTAAVHGDELNGIGIVRDLIMEEVPLIRGALILMPMVNVFGVEQRSRYLPDRRDLNRAFPGNPSGSLASRLANAVFRETIRKSDFGIDIHTAAIGRTNYPHVRADLAAPGLDAVARAFGCELILDNRGEPRTLRMAACKEGIPTLVFEAGEALTVDPAACAIGVRGIVNVLKHLGMVPGDVVPPSYQAIAQKSVWVRSHAGGLLRFHVAPGEVVDAGQQLATIDNFFAENAEVIYAPCDGVVLSVPTMPAVKPGDPVCHIAQPLVTPAQIRADIAARS